MFNTLQFHSQQSSSFPLPRTGSRHERGKISLLFPPVPVHSPPPSRSRFRLLPTLTAVVWGDGKRITAMSCFKTFRAVRRLVVSLPDRSGAGKPSLLSLSPCAVTTLAVRISCSELRSGALEIHQNRTIEMNPKDPTASAFPLLYFFTNRAWIAYTPPYSNPFLDNWLKSIQPHPHVTIQNICETPIRDLPLPAVFITDPTAAISDKRVILLLAREDAYETSGSWFVQGVGDFLLSEDPVAMELRKRTLFILIPIFDRDGVALGNAIHPLPAIGRSIFDRNRPKRSTLLEQRQLKRFQDWKSGLSHPRLPAHSPAHGGMNTLRPEFVTGASQASQSFIFTEIPSKSTSLVSAAGAPTAGNPLLQICCRSLFRHRHRILAERLDLLQRISTNSPCIKIPVTSCRKANFFARAVAEMLEIQDSNPPPSCWRRSSTKRTPLPWDSSPCTPFIATCSTAPTVCPVVVNDTPLISPGGSESPATIRRALLRIHYLDQPNNSYYFITASASRTRRIPRDSAAGTVSGTCREEIVVPSLPGSSRQDVCNLTQILQIFNL